MVARLYKCSAVPFWFIYQTKARVGLVEPNSIPRNSALVGFTQCKLERRIADTFTFVFTYGLGNVGGTSPNTLGPDCQGSRKPYDGQQCDIETSTCRN